MYFTALLAAASAFLLLPAITASPAPPLLPADSLSLVRRDQPLPRGEPGHDLYLKDDDEHKIYAQLESVFDTIDKIPDEVLESGDAETNTWLTEHGYRSEKLRRDLTVRDLEDRGFWDVAKCIGAISAFIASNAISAAKLLRIKKYIKALGGIRKSAELLLKASTWEERLREGGEALALLAGEILGTSLVANNC